LGIGNATAELPCCLFGEHNIKSATPRLSSRSIASRLCLFIPHGGTASSFFSPFLSFLLAMRSFTTLFTALLLPFYALAAHHGEHVRRHADVALRARGDLAERGDKKLTYYDITTGTYVSFVLSTFSMPHFLYSTACGGNYGPNAFVSTQCHISSAFMFALSFSRSHSGSCIEYRSQHLYSSSVLRDFDLLSFRSNGTVARTAGSRSPFPIMA
jgi:hypothetical protein